MAERRIFKFNLLPAKSEQEVALDVESTDSVFYAIILVLVGVVIYLAVLGVQAFVTTPGLRQAEAVLAARQAQISGFDDIKFNYGQLAFKLEAIKPLLGRQLNPDSIFATADAIRRQDPSIIVTAYGRQTDGRFNFSVVTNRAAQLPSLISSLQQNPTLRNITLPNIDFDLRAGTAKTSIQLDILETESGQGQTQVQNQSQNQFE